MIRKNMSKAQLAQMLGTSRSYVTQLLTGKPNLTLSTLFKICYTIGLKPVTRFETEPLVASVLEKGDTVSTHK
jgi:transcriptional regulator with XRE-family HTH domain